MYINGFLLDKLGHKFSVMNMGLNGRTTVIDDRLSPADGDYNCNGRALLKTVLHSCKPLHTVILALGANDLKTKFNSSPHEVVASLRALVRDVQTASDIGEYLPEGAGGPASSSIPQEVSGRSQINFYELQTQVPRILVVGPPIIKSTPISSVSY